VELQEYDVGSEQAREPAVVLPLLDSNLPLIHLSELNVHLGRAIAQAVSRWLSTAAICARARFRSCGICGGLIRTGAGFLLVLRFPLTILTLSVSPHSPSSVI
jgi:hypothetical protein